MFDASAFYIDWKDLQAEENYLAIPGDISSAVQSTVNASSATSKGIDMQLRVRPIEPLTLGASLACSMPSSAASRTRTCTVTGQSVR